MAYIKILAHFQKKYTFYFLFSFRSSSDNASSIQIGNCSCSGKSDLTIFIREIPFSAIWNSWICFSNVLKDKLIFWNIHQCR